jgi:hypothetical protein
MSAPSSAVLSVPSGPGSRIVTGMLKALIGRAMFERCQPALSFFHTKPARRPSSGMSARSTNIEASSVCGSLRFGSIDDATGAADALDLGRFLANLVDQVAVAIDQFMSAY